MLTLCCNFRVLGVLMYFMLVDMHVVLSLKSAKSLDYYLW